MRLNKILEWEYKVVTTDSLIQELQNHDIAVSHEASTARKESSKTNLESSLNKLGNDGWEFVTVIGEYGIFKKSKNGL
jgi:hypothetical protein